MALVAMKCPGCGADIELDDSREFGFCNYCGTKVMQDKIVVEHKGNVKIDNSEYVEKFLQNARRAKQKEDWEETEKYYNLVEQNDPTNIEAIFFSAYGKLRTTILENYSAKWDNDVGVLKKSISVLDDYFDMKNEKQNREVVIEAIKYLDMLRDVQENNVIVGQAPDIWIGGTNISSGQKKIKQLISALNPQITETIDNIIVKYKEQNVNYDYLTKIKEKYNNSSSSGCYVATAVYGSYDCPQVWTLRRYRDNTLAETWYGRAFIRTYYAVSPTIVKWFGDTVWFNKMWRGKLDRMVKKLNEQGYEDTPYNDR